MKASPVHLMTGYLFTHNVLESQGQPLGKRNRKVVSASLATALVASGSPYVALFAQGVQEAASQLPSNPVDAAEQALDPTANAASSSQTAVPLRGTIRLTTRRQSPSLSLALLRALSPPLAPSLPRVLRPARMRLLPRTLPRSPLPSLPLLRVLA